jgi:uncharacterized protein
MAGALGRISEMDIASMPPRSVLPVVDEMNATFWYSGRDGVLKLSRCQACGLWIHPASAICRRCLSRDIRPEAVSGRGTVATYTINRQPWVPDLTEPYIVALIELAEQDVLRLMSNVVNCPVESVYIGMPVEVVFLQQEDVWLPLFEPVKMSRRVAR